MSEQITIRKAALIAIFTEFLQGYPDPDDADPIGPWGPIIYETLERMRYRMGPFPEPWRVGIGQNRFASVMLNPQPLPPRLAYVAVLAEQLAKSVGNMYEMSEAMPSDFQGYLMEAARGRLHTFMDDCGNGRIPKWPFPWPPRDDSTFDPLGPVEMMTIGVTLYNASRRYANDDFRAILQETADQLINMAAEQM